MFDPRPVHIVDHASRFTSRPIGSLIARRMKSKYSSPSR
jgi:hypothetical protein